MAKSTFKFTFAPAIRRNWGFHDGVAAKARGWWPTWCRSWQDMRLAHFDKAYGEGFYLGFYGMDAPKGAILEG